MFQYASCNLCHLCLHPCIVHVSINHHCPLIIPNFKSWSNTYKSWGSNGTPAMQPLLGDYEETMMVNNSSIRPSFLRRLVLGGVTLRFPFIKFLSCVVNASDELSTKVLCLNTLAATGVHSSLRSNVCFCWKGPLNHRRWFRTTSRKNNTSCKCQNFPCYGFKPSKQGQDLLCLL